MLYVVVAILHVFVGMFLIAVVLLQRGKGADLAGAFGGGGSQTAFGPRGTANVLSRATTICAAAFMITSLGLSIMAGHATSSRRSVLEDVPAKGAPAPAVPPGPAESPNDQPQAPPPGSSNDQLPPPPPQQ
ncbi:MAG TPA: preprotein translocase subunit SecG [Candidatus Polarisedimenticolaceae bacterium]|nr:preprotein translocase subunit SecG [Candidatus Polarisedimenticolaceae bacterium]